MRTYQRTKNSEAIKRDVCKILKSIYNSIVQFLNNFWHLVSQAALVIAVKHLASYPHGACKITYNLLITTRCCHQCTVKDDNVFLSLRA